MIAKTPIMEKRIRKIPKSFSWIDHRLVRDKHLKACSHEQATLYLFLVCVADEKGLSYYGDNAIMAMLSMDEQTLAEARTGLIRNSLIAWQKPIYQVLDLEPAYGSRGTGSMMTLGDILTAATGGAR